MENLLMKSRPRGLGSPATEEERMAAAAELLRHVDPTTALEWLVHSVNNGPEVYRKRLREIFGCGCNDGSMKKDWLEQRLARVQCNDPNRRLSRMEEENLRAGDGFVVDLPTVNGAGATADVEIPAYGIPWYFVKFSVDGRVPDAASLSKVNIALIHAGRTISNFRVSQYYKENCCENIIQEWKRYRRCFGYASTVTIRVTNLNTNAGDTFTQGIFEWVRGYPADIDDLSVLEVDPAGGSCR